MTNDVQSRDAAAIPLWNEAYDVSVVGGQGNLWGDPPVPHAEVAARLFAEHSASVILDLPCGEPPQPRSDPDASSAGRLRAAAQRAQIFLAGAPHRHGNTGARVRGRRWPASGRTGG